jgi:plastocyanin
MLIELSLASTLALALAACSPASAEWTPLPSGEEPPAACARADADGVIEISADDLRFSAPCMVAPAGVAFVVRLTNDEAGAHNVSIFADQSTATAYFEGEIFNGPGVTKEYAVEALPAGDYFFHCALHPADMKGALYVR